VLAKVVVPLDGQLADVAHDVPAPAGHLRMLRSQRSGSEGLFSTPYSSLPTGDPDVFSTMYPAVHHPWAF
jgi:hypothetical protein